MLWSLVPDAAPSAPANPDEHSKLRAAFRDAGNWLLRLLLSPFVEVGALSKLLWESAFWGIRPPYRGRLFVEAMEFIGIGSIFLVSLTAVFVGGVLALQLVDGFRDFGAENQTGAVIGLALAREVGPVFAALMVTSRAGSAMTTELGSMRVTNQIDALVTMAVNPVQYLVVPRLVAGFVMVPVLTMLFNIVGVMGAFFVAVGLLGLDPGVFMDRLKWLVDWDDVSQGLIKAMVFGVAVTLIACRQGFYAKGGAAGVGRATNRAVVQSAIAILVLDYLVTGLVLGQGLL
ncbi:MAG: ABC transporter permease [Deltaproteobacteria bacterium]|nr:ABC transporter permease [Deltaproteobacteria bacterium]NND28670.1 ABC transporter permease [Myxococcales bacterium]MBT8466490.1 ABC transporter permease [Deltaproteobacteria bacterium]MBT8481864.1 ABC transporter permease [Deltaproteobacteria bacterium]NNK09548.1 ABC transporter permease [Myxococcales bacterium]